MKKSLTNDMLIRIDICKRSHLRMKSVIVLAVTIINSPIKTDYHLEIATNAEDHAVYIQRVMKKLNLPSKMIQRRNKYVVYILLPLVVPKCF